MSVINNIHFSREEYLRYNRHIIMPEVGEEGQKKLKDGRALIIGAGGLGSPIALYLAAAGMGTIGLVDFDIVDASNLQRQILHSTSQIGKSKLESAAKRLSDVNPHIDVISHQTKLTSKNALRILTEYDIIIDGTDNFPTRYLVNDACVLLGKPNVYGSIFRFDGQVSLFDARTGPCYRCLYPSPPPAELVPNCAEAGVIGVLPGIIGTLQALEAIKFILGIGDLLTGRLLVFDGLAMQFQEMRLRKNSDCPICGTHPTIHELIDYEEFCGYSNNISKKEHTQDMNILPKELHARLQRGDAITIIDVREQFEFEICNIGGLLIPLGLLSERLASIPIEREIVTLCHHGIRSAQAAKLLREAGFTNVKNLAGGIDAWSRDVDTNVQRY